MMRASIPVILASLLISSVAQAQAAYGSPTAPAPRGLPGTPLPISRIAPSDGAPQDVATTEGHGTAMPRTVGLSAETTFVREQRQMDRETVICSGCD